MITLDAWLSLRGPDVALALEDAAQTIRNSTISGNSAATGGGVALGQLYAFTSTLTVQNSTIANNKATTGSGGGIALNKGTGTIFLESTIVSGNINAAAPDIASTKAVNVASSAIGSGTGFIRTDLGENLPFQPHANLKLAALANNGGPTLTHLPAGDSPLVDAGSNSASLTTDQRGLQRMVGMKVDIGAAEVFNLVVMNANDKGPGSLRQTVQHANSVAGANTVTFDATVFATPQTITLTSGEMLISDSVTLNGPVARVSVSGGNASRIFNLDGSGTIAVTLNDLTLREGKITSGQGGCISNQDEALTINNCTITNNMAPLAAGIWLEKNGASLTVNNSLISNNTAMTGNGGGINANGTATITITNSTIANNTAAGGAGGLEMFFGGSLTITGSTFSGNKATGVSANGGGMELRGLLDAFLIRNSTISGNSAANGGGIAFNGAGSTTSTFRIQNSTIVNNSAGTNGGGITKPSGTSTITLTSTIISDNSAAGSGPDVSASTAILTDCLLGSASGITSPIFGGTTAALIGKAANLGPLANNGGTTQTHLPLPGSPSVDAGSNPAPALTLDQRGQPRVIGNQIDIGAAEAFNLVVMNNNDAGSGSLRQTLEHANTIAGADTVTFDAAVFATPQTITLASTLTISDAVTVTGPGARLATISGGNAVRVFDVDTPLSGQLVTLSGLTVANGKAGQGGAIASLNEALTLVDCAITGNTASGIAGGIITYNAPGSLTLVGCTVSGNSAGSIGGGIHANPGTVLTIRNSTFTNNTVVGDGGALNATGATTTIQNSTFTGNSAARGGAILSDSTISIESTVVSGNTSPDGPDIRANTVSVKNSAIGSTTGFTLNSQGGNILNQPHATLKLGVLQNNGGPTDTILPAADSPLVGKGSNPAVLVNDQRGPGFGRMRGTIDIGAVEAATNFVVTNNLNSTAGSLRQAILDAATFAGPDTITFDPTFFNTPRIILINGSMTIDSDVTITGPGAGLATINANATGRIFNIDGSGNLAVAISGLTMTGGNAGGGEGGAIAVADEILTLTDCVLTANTADEGGAIDAAASNGKLSLIRCVVANNTANGDDGGGLNFDVNGWTVTIVDSTISGNSATAAGGDGAGLYMFGGSLTMTGSTLSGNTAGNRGGGIYLGGTISAGGVTIRNSTISNNSAKSGGGIQLQNVGGTVNMQNSTMTQNQATAGDGGGINRNLGTSTINAVSTIVSGNTATGNGPDIFTTGTANLTDCLLGSASGITTLNASGSTGVLLGKAANLGPLANNGGLTQTHALLSNSPAIGQGSNPAPALTTDQRGKSRVVANIDIGAFELQPAAKVAGVLVNNGANQRSLVTSMRVTFDQPVILVGTPAAAFDLTRQGNGAAVTLSVAMDPTNTVATITFTGGSVSGTSLADGKYTLAVLAAQIGADGLDGNGDGTGGDNFTLVGSAATAPKLFRLFGDSDGDGDVDNTDFVAFRAAFGNGPSIFDSDGDGDTDNADFVAFRTRFGTTLP